MNVWFSTAENPPGSPWWRRVEWDCSIWIIILCNECLKRAFSWTQGFDPIQEFGTRTFLNSLDNEESKAMQPSDLKWFLLLSFFPGHWLRMISHHQIPSKKGVANNEVENGSINNSNGRTEHAEDKSSDPMESLDNSYLMILTTPCKLTAAGSETSLWFNGQAHTGTQLRVEGNTTTRVKWASQLPVSLLTPVQ